MCFDKKRKRNERLALIFIKYFSKIKQTEAHKKFYLFHKKTSQVLKSVRFVKSNFGYCPFTVLNLYRPFYYPLPFRHK